MEVKFNPTLSSFAAHATHTDQQKVSTWKVVHLVKCESKEKHSTQPYHPWLPIQLVPQNISFSSSIENETVTKMSSIMQFCFAMHPQHPPTICPPSCSLVIFFFWSKVVKGDRQLRDRVAKYNRSQQIYLRKKKVNWGTKWKRDWEWFLVKANFNIFSI